jgi:hypothetical protein
MHVLDEKLMYFSGRPESRAGIPRANERSFDDLGRESNCLRAKVGACFLGQRRVLLEEGAVKCIFIRKRDLRRGGVAVAFPRIERGRHGALSCLVWTDPIGWREYESRSRISHAR